jgi:tetratricopeptide (TPR) repeat protein
MIGQTMLSCSFPHASSRRSQGGDTGQDQEMIESCPREFGSYYLLGIVFASQGQYEKAAEITKQGLRLAPDQVYPYETHAAWILALQHLDEAGQVNHEAQARKQDDCFLHGVLSLLPCSGRTPLSWQNSNSSIQAGPKRTLDLRSHPTLGRMAVISARSTKLE